MGGIANEPVHNKVLDEHGGISIMCMNVVNHTLVTGGTNHSAVVWDLNAGKKVRELYGKDGHREWVTCVDQAPDSSVVITGGMDNIVCLWRGVSCTRLVGHNSSISSVKIDSSNTAISASYDGTIAVWSVSSKRRLTTLIPTLTTAKPSVTPAVAAPTLAVKSTTTGRTGGRAGVSAAVPSGTTKSLGASEAAMTTAFWRQSLVVGGTRGGGIFMWDISSGACILGKSKRHSSAVTSIVAADGDSVFVTTGSDGKVILWDSRSGAESAAVTLRGSAAEAVVAPGNSHLVVVPAADKAVHVLDVRQALLPVHSMQGHRDAVLCAAMGGVSGCVASGAGDGALLVHDIVTGKCLYGFGAGKGSLRCVAVTADESRVAATGDDGLLTLLEYM